MDAQYPRARLSALIAALCLVLFYSLLVPSGFAALTPEQALFARIGRVIGALLIPALAWLLVRVFSKKRAAACYTFTALAVLKMGLALYSLYLA